MLAQIIAALVGAAMGLVLSLILSRRSRFLNRENWMVLQTVLIVLSFLVNVALRAIPITPPEVNADIIMDLVNLFYTGLGGITVGLILYMIFSLVKRPPQLQSPSEEE